MKRLTILLTIFVALVTFAGCNSKPAEPQGNPFLVNAAKNSRQAKKAEAAVNDAAEKAKANAGAALKQIQDMQPIPQGDEP